MITLKTYKNLTFELHQSVGILTINREAKLNAINSEVLKELKDIFDDLKTVSKKELIGIILTGAGKKAFIAGADIAELAGLNPAQALEVSTLGQEVSYAIENFNRPLIAAVNGHAMGGGLEMALCCDFMYVTENALLALPEVKLGLIPGFGGTKRLANIVGPSKAKEIIFSGRIIDAKEAVSLGLCLKIFSSKEEMLDSAQKWLHNASKNSLMAISSAKRAIQEGLGTNTKVALQNETNYFANLFATHDMLEGTKAFMEKRSANFKQE